MDLIIEQFALVVTSDFNAKHPNDVLLRQKIFQIFQLYQGTKKKKHFFLFPRRDRQTQNQNQNQFISTTNKYIK